MKIALYPVVVRSTAATTAGVSIEVGFVSANIDTDLEKWGDTIQSHLFFN